MLMYQETIVLLIVLQVSSAAKILSLAIPLNSHFHKPAIISEALAERGHDVWMTTTKKLEKKMQLKNKNLKSVPFQNDEHILKLADLCSIENFDFYMTTGTHTSDIGAYQRLQHAMLTDELFISTIKDYKFDLVLMDSVPVSTMLSFIPYKFDIPFILISHYYDPVRSRIPFTPAVIANRVALFSDKMTFSERLINTITFLGIAIANPFTYSNASSTYAPEKPSLDPTYIIRKAELTLLEYNFMLDYPMPFMPDMVPIGYVTSAHDAPLPKEFINFIEKSSTPIVLVSFGSLPLSGRHAKVFEKIIKAFKSTPYSYIIKGSFAKSDNQLLVKDWIPQADLLNHLKVGLFVTHCGFNGLFESIASGVPMLGLPLFAEQPANAFRMQSRGYGITKDLYNDSAEDIGQTIISIMEYPQYRIATKRAAAIIKARGGNATKDAVFWIEHILKYGGGYLRSSALDIPLYQYAMINVFAFFGIIILLVFTMIFLISKTIYRRIFGGKHKKE